MGCLEIKGFLVCQGSKVAPVTGVNLVLAILVYLGSKGHKVILDSMVFLEHLDLQVLQVSRRNTSVTL